MLILAYLLVLRPRGRGGGGGWRGYSTNVYMFIRGGSAPRSNSLHFYKPFFYVKGTPFVYLLLTNGISFTDELCIPFNYRYCTVLIGINHRNRTFSRLFKAIKFIHRQYPPPPPRGIRAYRRLWLDFRTRPYIYYACSNFILFHPYI